MSPSHLLPLCYEVAAVCQNGSDMKIMFLQAFKYGNQAHVLMLTIIIIFMSLPSWEMTVISHLSCKKGFVRGNWVSLKRGERD
jgi:hypothetical protein